MNDRDCENCKHHTKKGCKSWDCNFEQITTREKAIKKLKDILEEATETDNSVCYVTSDDADDLKVAINSLEIDERYELEYEQIEPCEDAISRQAVEDALYEYSENNDVNYNLIITEYIDTIPSINPQEPKWIPVSERLPEDGTYLVTVERIVGELGIDMKSFAKDLNRVDEYDFPKHKCGWYDYDSEYGYWEDTGIIAWMPLPKPYKAESEVQDADSN